MSAPATLDLVREPEQASNLLHPLRQQILEQLQEPDSATGLAPRLGLSRQKLNYHLKELAETGLIELVEERPRRGCVERVYRTTARAYLICPQVLGEFGRKAEDVQDEFSSAYQAALAAQTLRELAELRAGADAVGKRLATFSMQSEVRFASLPAMENFVRDLTDAVAEVIARHHDERSAKGRRFRFFLGAHPKLRTTTTLSTEENAS